MQRVCGFHVVLLKALRPVGFEGASLKLWWIMTFFLSFYQQSRSWWISVWGAYVHFFFFFFPCYGFANRFAGACTHWDPSCRLLFSVCRLDSGGWNFGSGLTIFFRVALNVWQKITHKMVSADTHSVVPSVTPRRTVGKMQNLCGLKRYFPFLSAGSYVLTASSLKPLNMTIHWVDISSLGIRLNLWINWNHNL